MESRTREAQRIMMLTEPMTMTIIHDNNDHSDTRIEDVELQLSENGVPGTEEGPAVPGANGPNEKHGEWRMHQATKPQLGPTTQIFMLSRA